LLDKIKGKKAHTLVDAAVETLSWQLKNETMYRGEQGTGSKKGQMREIREMLELIKKLDEKEVKGKLSLIYDMVMASIVVKS
jgi:hypothetical protein